jgi:hypothetical protein
MEKVISSYKHMLNAPVDEDTVMRKCQSALSIFDNLNKAYENNSYLGKMIHWVFQYHNSSCLKLMYLPPPFLNYCCRLVQI